MARPTNEELEVKNKSMFDTLMEKFNDLAGKVSGLEAENEQLKTQAATTKGKKFKVVGAGNSVDSDWHSELAERNRLAEENVKSVVLHKEAGFKGLEDMCPYCNSENRHNLIDLNPRSGRYQCRACSKCWEKKLLGLPYDQLMESGQYDIKTLNDYVLKCRAEKVSV